MKSAQQLVFEAAEQEYEVTRLAVEAQQVPRAKLEKIALKVAQAALDYARSKNWIL